MIQTTGRPTLALLTSLLAACSTGSEQDGDQQNGGTTNSPHEELFKVEGDALVVREEKTFLLDREVTLQIPTWGRHDGPLLALSGESAGTVEVLRVDGVNGAITTTTIDAGIPAGAFLGARAVDLPFGNATLVSWSGAYPDTAGEIILLKDDHVLTRYPVNGYYDGSFIGDADGGRLLFSALSPLGDTETNTNALYAADSCSDEENSLLPESTETCAGSFAVAAWGDASGPVVADSTGNIFAVFPSIANGTQEARGFAKGSISKGAAASLGLSMFTADGFAWALAALAPTDTKDGLLIFQGLNFDPETGNYVASDVYAQNYVLSEGALRVVGEATAQLSTEESGAQMSAFVDSEDELWLSGPSKEGGTLFVALARK